MKKTRRLYVRISDEEFKHLSELAKEYGIPRAELIRRLIANEPLPTPKIDFKIIDGNIKQLLKMNADIARIGNIFKLILNQNKTITITEIQSYLNDLQNTQNDIKSLIANITKLINQ